MNQINQIKNQVTDHIASDAPRSVTFGHFLFVVCIIGSIAYCVNYTATNGQDLSKAKPTQSITVQAESKAPSLTVEAIKAQSKEEQAKNLKLYLENVHMDAVTEAIK